MVWNNSVSFGRPSRSSKARPDARLIAGTLAVGLLLFGTRWASHISVGPIYLADLLLLGAVVNEILASTAVRRPTLRHIVWPPLTLVLLLVWVAIRFAVGGVSAASIRDAAPYFYAIVGLLSWHSARRADAAVRARTFTFLFWVLGLHACWFVFVTFVPSVVQFFPVISAVQGVRLFTPRPDMDVAVLGMFTALILLKIFRSNQRRLGWIVAYAVCWVAAAASPSRAGVLGAVTANLVVMLLIFVRLRATKTQLVLAAAVPLAAILFAAILPTTPAGTKFLAAVFPTAATDSSGYSEWGENTAKARSDSWARLNEWTLAEDPSRAILGAGYGPDILAESGALWLLVSAESGGAAVPRSPHNYWVGTLARNGIIGTALVILPIVVFLVRAYRARGRLLDDPLSLMVVIIAVSLILPATFGVVLESPFGAVPFFWALGVGFSTMGKPPHPPDAPTTQRSLHLPTRRSPRRSGW